MVLWEIKGMICTELLDLIAWNFILKLCLIFPPIKVLFLPPTIANKKIRPEEGATRSET
jgi:hypothetical protein